jgi:hypothetical protein
MAKTRKPPKSRAMPELGGWFICEKVLIEQDLVSSAIRIVDIVDLPSDAPLELGRLVSLPLTVVLIIKNGPARGRVDFTVRLRTPTGETATGEKPLELLFSGAADTGHHVRMPLRIKWTGEGLYWFELVSGETVFARTPLRVRIAPATPGSGPQGSSTLGQV